MGANLSQSDKKGRGRARDLSQVFISGTFRDVPFLTMRRRSGGRIDFKGSQVEKEILLWGVRWYVASPISDRPLEEMRGERGVTVDHATLNRWVRKYAPEVEKPFRRHQCPVRRSGRREETDGKIRGKWAYLYRAVDPEGHPIAFLLTPHRDRAAAAAFLPRALRSPRRPEQSTMDQSGSHTAAIPHSNQVHKTALVSRHSK